MRGKILVVGSPNMDLVVAPRLPQVGETILGGKFAPFPRERVQTKLWPLPEWGRQLV
jgi:hypothetical protein